MSIVLENNVFKHRISSFGQLLKKMLSLFLTMVGLYIHIPFCKKRCIYCDFYSGVDTSQKARYIRALAMEWESRRSELGESSIDTVYLGGGTPSQLTISELKSLFDRLSGIDWGRCKEVTIEVNPDDLTESYIEGLTSLPINRISMGIQSFEDSDLSFLNRRHTSLQAVEAVKLCQASGFDNLSIDLIYGLPGQTLESWAKNIEMAISLKVPHISAYNLIYEQGTVLYRLLQEGKVEECDDDLALQMFDLLIDRLTCEGFVHYEISNFALPGCYSRHNTAYWQNVPYLGIGASAHSYDGYTRSWNVADLRAYCDKIESGCMAYTVEPLSCDDLYNDLVMTSLRTMWGLDLNKVKSLYGNDRYLYCLKQADGYIRSGHLNLTGECLRLTRKGLFISDAIMSDLFYVD